MMLKKHQSKTTIINVVPPPNSNPSSTPLTKTSANKCQESSRAKHSAYAKTNTTNSNSNKENTETNNHRPDVSRLYNHSQTKKHDRDLFFGNSSAKSISTYCNSLLNSKSEECPDRCYLSPRLDKIKTEASNGGCTAALYFDYSPVQICTRPNLKLCTQIVEITLDQKANWGHNEDDILVGYCRPWDSNQLGTPTPTKSETHNFKQSSYVNEKEFEELLLSDDKSYESSLLLQQQESLLNLDMCSSPHLLISQFKLTQTPLIRKLSGLVFQEYFSSIFRKISQTHITRANFIDRTRKFLMLKHVAFRNDQVLRLQEDIFGNLNSVCIHRVSAALSQKMDSDGNQIKTAWDKISARIWSSAGQTAAQQSFACVNELKLLILNQSPREFYQSVRQGLSSMKLRLWVNKSTLHYVDFLLMQLVFHPDDIFFAYLLSVFVIYCSKNEPETISLLTLIKQFASVYLKN